MKILKLQIHKVFFWIYACLFAVYAPVYAKETPLSETFESIDFTVDIAPDHKPISAEEIALWKEADELEAKFLKQSSKIIKDAELNAYVKSVLCRAIGDDRCAPIRLYLVRTTYFNALMAPNGMMQVWSGLLIRMENEAQLAAILAHEYAHYARRHSLQTRRLAQNLEWASSVPYVGILTAVGSVGSILAFNREMESEADRLSLEYIYKAGYEPEAPSKIWRQLLDEFSTNESKRENSIFDNFFSTHPNSEERMTILADLARSKDHSGTYVANTVQYREALGEWWPKFINDQVEAKDFKTGEYLVDQLAKRGWDSELYFAKAELYRKRGQKGDFALAASHYQKSIDGGSQKPENWRGLGLALLRSNDREIGKAMLNEYLRRLPNAADKNMINLLAGTKKIPTDAATSSD